MCVRTNYSLIFQNILRSVFCIYNCSNKEAHVSSEFRDIDDIPNSLVINYLISTTVP